MLISPQSIRNPFCRPGSSRSTGSHLMLIYPMRSGGSWPHTWLARGCNPGISRKLKRQNSRNLPERNISRRNHEPSAQERLLDVGIAAVAVLVGAGIVYLGDKLLGVTLERFYGVETFTLFWVADLFLVPFIAGIVVSLIYGLGGKMLAHLCPVIVRVISYYELH